MRSPLAAAMLLAVAACATSAGGGDNLPIESDFELWRKSATSLSALRKVSADLGTDLETAATCWAGSELRFALIETEEPAVEALLAKGLVVEHDIWAYHVLSLMTAEFAATAEAEGTPFMQDASSAMGSQLLTRSFLLAGQARESAKDANETLIACDETLAPALRSYMKSFVGRLRILLPTDGSDGGTEADSLVPSSS